MNNFYEELKIYFNTNTKEKILEDWNKCKEWDNIGPTVEQFLNQNNHIDSENKIKQSIKCLIEKYQIILDSIKKLYSVCPTDLDTKNIKLYLEGVIRELNNILENNK